MKKILLLLACAALSCSGSQVTTQEKPDPEASYDESFDPMSLDDKELVIPKSSTREYEITEDIWESIQGKYSGKAVSEDETVMGFRVQIHSSLVLEEAIKIKYEAAQRFKDEVYLVYESPAYKVRVGNFRDKEKADALSKLAAKSGYVDAWVVRTKVLKAK